MKMHKVVLEAKIVLEVDGQTVQLTLDEARDLHAQLAELFVSKVTTVPIVIERDRYPGPWTPYRPYWVTETGTPPNPYNTLTY